eukprot:COSAG01_NODE_7722_length_3084_cov_5.128643_1_plen_81_part_00
MGGSFDKVAACKIISAQCSSCIPTPLHHDQGAKSRSSRAALLSGAARISMTCGSAFVPVPHFELITVNAESVHIIKQPVS